MALYSSRIAELASEIEATCSDSASASFPAVVTPWEHILPRFVDTAGEGATKKLLSRVRAVGERFDAPVYITPALYALSMSSRKVSGIDGLGDGHLALLCLCAPPNHARSGAYLYASLAEMLRSPVRAEDAYGAVCVADRVLCGHGSPQQGAPWSRRLHREPGRYTSGDVLLAAGVSAMLELSGHSGPEVRTWPAEWLEPPVSALISATENDPDTPEDVRYAAGAVRAVLSGF